MSDRERCAALLEELPEARMAEVIDFLQRLADDEEADDAFCEQLYQDYLNDPDPDKDKEITIEELAAREGVIL